jgi:hypothetical protein
MTVRVAAIDERMVSPVASHCWPTARVYRETEGSGLSKAYPHQSAAGRPNNNPEVEAVKHGWQGHLKFLHRCG